MNSIELIRNRAGDLMKRASEIRTQYDFSLIKSAALNSLVESGCSEEQAIQAIDSYAAQYVPPHAGEMLKLAELLEQESQVLEKVATMFAETGSKLEETTGELESLRKEATLAPALDSLKSRPDLSENDLEALKSLPESTLMKIASEQGPWDLGKATTGHSASGTVDPLAAFCLS